MRIHNKSLSKFTLYFIGALLIFSLLYWKSINNISEASDKLNTAELRCIEQVMDEEHQRTMNWIQSEDSYDLEKMFSISDIIRDRRLQEAYCLKLARCSYDTSKEDADVALASYFLSCLNEEP